MRKRVSKEARNELVEALRERYRAADRAAKGLILKEFTAISGYHRKHAIRILKARVSAAIRRAVGGRRIYHEAVRQALVVLWEAADRICGKRLKALIPSLLGGMERHGHLKLEATVGEQLLKVSASSIDRLLIPVRKSAGSRRKKRPIKRVSKEIPIRTFHDSQDCGPGYLEIDFVVHGGGSMAGEYLHSLVATDVYSGWTEAVALLAREQSLVVEGIERIRRQMPVAVLGIDSDNDGAFINDTVASYCQREQISFTRSRAYHKNDQAWIEQKNGAVIRRMIGHGRLSGIVAGQTLAQFFQVLRLYVNCFQPSFKLRERVREAGRMKKSYHPPATPCERLLEHPSVEQIIRETLRKQLIELDPVALLHRIRQGQSALAALSQGDLGNGPERESLSNFLAKLPEMWKSGEVRATHRRESAKARHWRTHEDAFAGVWADLLLWLQHDPDCTAKSLLCRLEKAYPGRFQVKQLRTLQRRIGEWRKSMAKTLILEGIPEPILVETVQ